MWCVYPDYFVVTGTFFLRSKIDIKSKRSWGGGGVRAELILLLVQAGAGAELFGSPGGGTGDLLFLPLYVLAKLPLILGGMGIYLGLRVEELFTSFLILIGVAISAAIPPHAWLIVAHPPICINMGFIYVSTWQWVGIKGGLVIKLGMKEAFTSHLIFYLSVKKHYKETSVDIESL